MICFSAAKPRNKLHYIATLFLAVRQMFIAQEPFLKSLSTSLLLVGTRPQSKWEQNDLLSQLCAKETASLWPEKLEYFSSQ